jgi:predicted Zn finger-like uncharacterized protein
MKFTCENCGAQYLIADTKLGERGVKVRCKKCSYVIILRPRGFSPEGKDDIQSEDLDSPTVVKEPAEPPPSIGSTMGAREMSSSDALDPSAATKIDPVLEESPFNIATSSDMGLSQEFAALGFEEREEARRLEVEIDAARVAHAAESGSPFADEGSGGSLEYVPPEAKSLGLGGFAGSHDSQRPEADATEVLARRRPLGESIPSIEERGDSTSVDEMPSVSSEPKASGGEWPPSGGPTVDAFDDPADAPARSFGHERSFGDEISTGEVAVPDALSSLVQDEEDAIAAVATRPAQSTTGEISIALSSVVRNELQEMKSSLEEDLVGFSDTFSTAKKGSAPVADEQKPLDSLNALAAEPAPRDDYNLIDRVRAEEEIGSAFEAMFGGEGNGNGTHKAPTRVFDVEAMQRVEAEQAIARPGSDETPEWYVAVEDNQVGPLTISEVVEKWEDGDLGAESLCWKQGMDGWQPIKLTAELRVHLGSMEDRERTEVTHLDGSEDDSLVDDAPPGPISIAPDIGGKEAPQPMAASGLSALGEAVEDTSWRPSAASALASLAAEELSAPAPIAHGKRDDIAVGAALPATSDALEKLLHGEGGGASASQFGAAEKSESYVRPLPRRAEAVSSAPLRDPVVPSSRSNLMIPAAILGGFVMLAGVLAAVAFRDDPPPVPQGAVAMVQHPSLAMPPDPPAPPAVEVDEPKPEEAPKALEEKAPPPVEAAASGKADEDEGEGEDEGGEDEGAKKDKKSRKTSKKKTPKAPPTKERRETVVERAAPPPPPRTPTSEVDDLLLPAERRRLPAAADPEDDVPVKLDDADILKVLRKNRQSIIDCVKKQKSADGSVSGTMMVNLVIAKNGTATRIQVTPDRYRTTVAGKCVASAVTKWKFPRFTGPNMPIDFPVRI